MSKADYSDGISQFISMMPELSLDLPEIHKYLFNFIIKPLVLKGMMTIKFLRFDRELPKLEEDDYVFDNTDFHFRLIAMILDFEYQKKNQKSDLDEFIKICNWSKTFK